MNDFNFDRLQKDRISIGKFNFASVRKLLGVIATGELFREVFFDVSIIFATLSSSLVLDDNSLGEPHKYYKSVWKTNRFKSWKILS